MLTSIFLIIAILNIEQNEALLDFEHPYEVLNFDKSVLTELKLHRKRRSIDDDLEQEIDRRWKRDLYSHDLRLLDDRANYLHMYSRGVKVQENEFKLNDDDLMFSDDDLFRRRKLRNQIKHDLLNEDDRHFKLNFDAHKRNFKLLLKSKHHNDVFAPDVQFESTKGRFNYDKDNIINGFLEDENGSYIEGVITHDGLIDALIKTGDEEFYIEPARNYLNSNKMKSDEEYRNKTKNFHSIIYKLSDLKFPNITYRHPLYEPKNSQNLVEHHLKKRETNKHKLTSTHQSSIKSLSLTNSTIEPDQLNNRYLQTVRKNNVATSGKKPVKKLNRTQPINNRKFYWKELDALHYNSEAYGVRAIQRTHWTSDIEQQSHLVVDSRKSTCMLYLQADHLFFNRMGSEEACVESMIRHVQKVNSIYRMTDFDQDGKPDNISFLIKRIKVHTTDALQDSEYRFPSNYGVERFLELFSEEDYDAFCLAYMFTYRDFEGGTLGLAWTGDLKNAGGVCEKNGHYRGSLKSLNTGIVTLLNYGKHVPPSISSVTMTHEIGHNFGSAHDPEDDSNCTPGGENGNYVMYARATSGDKKNNDKFSQCSLKSINAVLNTKARSLKGCFQEPQESICGNGVVEANEECDCGWEESCTEPCCYPQRNNPPANETPCKLRPGFVCSPSQGPCCTHDTCRLKVGNRCRDDNGCRTASYCSGQGPSCPPSVNKPNKTICNEESVCYMGECTGSICIAYGLESCQCKRKEGVDHKRGDPLCELCCRLPGDDSTCKSSFEWNSQPFDVPDLMSKPGTPCDDYRGYCDVNQICREVHPTGLGFIRYLLSDQSISLIRNWMQHQYICAGFLCCIAFLLCALLLRALQKAQKQRETCKSASNLLGPAGLLSNIGSNIANNSITSAGFLPNSLFGHSTVNNPPQPPNAHTSGALQPNDANNTGAYTNPYNDSTYGVTGNANYSNAYGYTPIANNQQANVTQSTYGDYGLTSNPSLVSNANTVEQQNANGTSLIDSIYGSSGLKANQTTAYLNNQTTQPIYTNSSINTADNEVKNLASNYTASSLNTLNNPAQYLSSNLSNNLTNNLSTNLSSSLSSRQPYNQFQPNYTPYSGSSNSNHLINRQKRLPRELPNNSVIKNLSSAINSTSSSYKPCNSSGNSSSSSSSRLKNYAKNSPHNYNNYSGPSFSASSNQQMNASNYQPTYPANQQQQFFQQPSHHLNRTNSTSATEYGHAPLSLPNNQWV